MLVSLYASASLEFVKDGLKYSELRKGVAVVCLGYSDGATRGSYLLIPGFVTYNGVNYRVERLDATAFYQERKIQTVQINYGVKYIDRGVFSGCTLLSKVYLPSSIVGIDSDVFYNTDLKNMYCAWLNLPSEIDAGMFGDVKVANIYVPTQRMVNILTEQSNKSSTAWSKSKNSLTFKRDGKANDGYINEASCVVTKQATSTQPGEMTVTGLYASGGYSLTLPAFGKVVLDDGYEYRPTEIADSAFLGCNTIETAKIENAYIKRLGKSAFRNMTALKTLTFPTAWNNHITTVDSYCFSGSAITVANLPYGIKTMGAGLFYNCSSLEYVHFPSSIKDFGSTSHNYLLVNCTSLKCINMAWDTPRALGSTLLFNNVPKSCTIRVPESSGSTYGEESGIPLYKKSNYWNRFSNFEYGGYDVIINNVGYIIKNDRYEMEARVCRAILDYDYNSFVSNLNMNPTIQVVDDHYTVTTMDRRAFENCTSLKSVVLPNKLWYLKGGMYDSEYSTSTLGNQFKGCTSLTSFKIPNNTEMFYFPFGFLQNTGIQELELPERIHYLGAYSLAGCSNLMRLVVNYEGDPSDHGNGVPLFGKNCLEGDPTTMKCYVKHAYLSDYYDIIEAWNITISDYAIFHPWIKIGPSGILPFSLEYAVKFGGVSGLTTYYVSDFNTSTRTAITKKVTGSSSEMVSTNVPLIFKGTPGQQYFLTTFSNSLFYLDNKMRPYNKKVSQKEKSSSTYTTFYFNESRKRWEKDAVDNITENGSAYIKLSNSQYGANKYSSIYLDILGVPSTIEGDVNGDDKVDVEDVNAIINIILELKSTSNYPGDADVNGDNKVDIEDVNAVINIILTN